MARDPQDPPAPLRIGRWRVDPSTDTVALDGRVHKLEPRTMRLLLVLAARPGEVVPADALLDAVWPGVVVTGQSLYQAVGELRAVLKADAATPAFIANVPRKGYRLVAPVATVAPETAAPAAAATAPRRPPVDVDERRSLAVLPFRDLGLPGTLAFLPETLLGGLILELSRQPELSPIALGTMLSYAGRATTPREVADDLGVRYVIDGTIAPLGDTLQVVCELVDAASAAVLASDEIAVPAAQWPALAQHVVGRLARSARLQLSAHAARVGAAHAPGDASALELAMRAWVELYGRPQRRETNERAWAWALQALQRDDGLGAAWNAVACCEWRAAQYGWSGRGRSALLADAVAHAQRATALAPLDPDGWYTLGLASHSAFEAGTAEASLRHCLEISASYAPAYGLLGLVRSVRGHPQEAAALCRRAFALSPREPLRAVWHWVEASAASMLGRDDEALEHAVLGIAANPDHPACYLVAAVSSQRLGGRDAAARYATVLRRTAFCSVERLRTTMPSMQVEPWAGAFLADLHAAGLPLR